MPAPIGPAPSPPLGTQQLLCSGQVQIHSSSVCANHLQILDSTPLFPPCTPRYKFHNLFELITDQTGTIPVGTSCWLQRSKKMLEPSTVEQFASHLEPNLVWNGTTQWAVLAISKDWMFETAKHYCSKSAE